MMQHILALFVCFVCGVVLAFYTTTPLVSWVIALIMCAVLTFSWPKKYPTTRLVLFGTLCIAFGGCVTEYRAQGIHPSCDDVPVSYQGRVISYAEEAGSKVAFSFLGENDCAYHVILLTPRPIHIGDTIVLTGIKKKERTFWASQYLQYMYKNNGTLFVRSVHVHGQGYSAFSLLERIRETITASVSSFSVDSRGLFLGVVLGEKNALSFDTKQMFVLSGLIHIVVLSGQNLSYIGLLFWKSARRVGFKFGLGIGVMATILYVCIGGGEPPSLRAGCMVLLVFLAYAWRMYPHGPRVFWFSVCVLLSLSPALLLNMSFLFSCLAMIGMLYISPLVEYWMLQKGMSPISAGYLAPIVGVQAFLLPLIVLMSEHITPYALVANICVLFVVPFVGMLSLLHVCLFLFAPGFICVISQGALEYVLGYIMAIAKSVSMFPYASVHFSIDPLWVWVWYGGCGVLCFFSWKNKWVTPLSVFALREERRQEARGIVPWFHDDTQIPLRYSIDSGIVHLENMPGTQHEEQIPDIQWK
jgi:ComEC/Rec2-related protein